MKNIIYAALLATAVAVPFTANAGKPGKPDQKQRERQAEVPIPEGETKARPCQNDGDLQGFGPEVAKSEGHEP